MQNRNRETDGSEGVDGVCLLLDALRLAVLMEELGSDLQVCVCVSQTEDINPIN